MAIVRTRPGRPWRASEFTLPALTGENNTVRALQEAAEAGHSEAMTNLGYLYSHGLGTTQDYAEAARWYRKAAEAGNAIAMLNLAELYTKGLGGAPNRAKARYWLEKAMDLMAAKQ